MRIFFVVDGKSSIDPESLRLLLKLRFSEESYAVMPLEPSRFHHNRVRTKETLNILERQAEAIAKRIFDRYEEAERCIVVVGVQDSDTQDPTTLVWLDYSMVIKRHSLAKVELLNPESDPVDGKVWASSPSIRPELTERVVERSGIEQIFKDHLLPR